MKAIQIFILFFVASAIHRDCFCQQKQNNVHQSSLGIDFILSDYGPSLYDKLNFQPLKKWVPGVSFNYMQRFSDHYAFTIMAAASFHDSILKKSSKLNKKLLLETSVSLNRKFGSSMNRIQPFISTGVGASVYYKHYGVFIPAGIGLQTKISKDVFTTINAQYRFGVRSPLLSHFMYSIGIAGTLNRQTKERKIIPVMTYSVSNTQRVNADRDHDGIIDAQDSCVDIPGFIENKGCPLKIIRKDTGIYNERELVKKNDFEISIDSAVRILYQLAKQITFESNGYILKPSSHKPLNKTAELLKNFMQINLTIEGHTDDVGKQEQNLVLSQKRADAVLNYLSVKGITIDRLAANGYGEAFPMASNETEWGRCQNRRVEFKTK